MLIPPPQSDPQQTLYFAYGSNLSLYQMSTRCPTSNYFSFGVLPSYRWIISQRGYANVVYSPGGTSLGESRTGDGAESKGVDKKRVRVVNRGAEAEREERRPDEGRELPGHEATPSQETDTKTTGSERENTECPAEDTVEGLLYYLQPADEARLDVAEGVPHAYTKHILDISIPQSSSTTSSFSNTTSATNHPTTVRALVYVDLTRTSPGTCREEYVARMNRGIRDARSKGMSDGYVKEVLRKWVRDEPVPGGRDGEIDDPFAVAR